jgi:hypothetical protein
MWQMKRGERRVSGAFKWDSLAKGRKTPTKKKLRVGGGFFRHGEATPLREYTLRGGWAKANNLFLGNTTCSETQRILPDDR